MRSGGWMAALAGVALCAAGLAHAGDAPEISRSIGKKGGVVVLWPRVGAGVPDGTAQAVQAALTSIAGAVTAQVDVRPAPQRVCPRETGCKGAALGAVISAREAGCVVVATVSAPGTTPATLVPWVGEVRLTSPSSPFREPPESLVVVTDFARCADVPGLLDAGASKVREALAKAIEG